MSAILQPLAAVLDDDPDVVVTLSLQLHALGMEARCHSRPEALLAELPILGPRLLIVDLELGRSNDGIEVLRRLAECRYAGAVLLLSGVESKIIHIAERVGRTLGLHMLDPLGKPYRLTDLRRRLEDISPRVVSERQSGDVLRSQEEVDLALTRDEFIVHYQPQFELASNRLSGVEALVRWQHPEMGLLQPGQFLPLMTPDQCQALTRRVASLALRDADRWSEAGLSLSMAINVTPAELMNAELLSLMDNGRRGLSHRAPIVLEITESDSMDDELLGGEVAARLRLHGVEVSVDDFGVGFSSLSRLQLLPISELKIDRSFVRDIHEASQDAAIVEAVALLGQRLGIRVVAEGVESLDRLPLLRTYGCTHVQGFALGRPMPAEQIPVIDRMLPA
ncbi:diguanylate phosphodiesterase [Litchfieldella qijiaojingensis]|uniref:Diguanylate phosphodiesterase n=1 Tax=Litchfieldella qijiaojingensis TaxID=980347 RepID=A0ABQ2YST7_9GAMM|nr:EAL domain-containing response regulator [Halomonas qijiaojingensis]GGX94080.1 diguanylate phosphodiesterase [Halomonas qijiaojingensis]